MSKSPNPVAEYVSALKASDRLGDQVAHHEILPAAEAQYAENKRPWPRAVQRLLDESGIDALYAHQAQATDMIRSGRHVVVATPTASGKTFVYNLPVLERCLSDPDTRALYLFPLKALAQDQLKAFNALTEGWPKDARPQAAIYDGDTTPWFRKKIRENPPHALLTNPEMLHLSLCPHHDKWASFLAGLSFIVVDEVHTYRGVLGSHMAQLFRRLNRICARFGASPTYIFCSATVGNPDELAAQLTGVDVTPLTQSGAPQGKRHFLFLNPLESPAQAAIMMLQAALHRGLRTIIYTQSRKMTELISLWATQRSGKFKDKISAYRAGFLPEERREIEARMSSGELLAVVSTSALELGIDIGALDLCILVGYPGTIMATLQRGGRVGRAKQESAVALIAQEDALDQYFMRHPQEFFLRPPETAVLNPYNPVILSRHLDCAAAESPLRDDEVWMQDPKARAVALDMEDTGRLLRSADGRELYSKRKQPQRDISLRGSGNTYLIEEQSTQTGIGSIDEHRAFKETHEGAVYLHLGRSFVVEKLDLVTKSVRVAPKKVDYYTRPRGNKTTEIIEVQAQKVVMGTRMGLGRLKVTETVTGYEKRRVRDGKLLNIIPLELPPLIFETDGLWFEVPIQAQRACEDEYFHFMGGIHALEHAAIGILPLLVMTDRNDLGGISTPMHPQVGLPAVFIYDGVPGGVGLAAQAFAQGEELFQRTRQSISACECELGCPSCVHSPKCGSGNRPIDKAAASFLLERLMNDAFTGDPEQQIGIEEQASESASAQEDEMSEAATKTEGSYGVLDVETQKSAEEVGGWGNIRKMLVSVAVLYDSREDAYIAYREDELDQMFARLKELDLVIGFNILRFDYTVLGHYTKTRLKQLPTLDMLEHVRQRLGFRLSLDHLASATLGAEKSADGLQALEWWKQGLVDKIIEYCEKDVRLTHDLFRFGRENGYVLYTNKAKKKARLKVSW